MSPTGEDSGRRKPGQQSRRRFLISSVGIGAASLTGFHATDIARASGGDVLWENTVSLSINSSPTVVNGQLYIGDREGRVWAFDADVGYEVWNFDSTIYDSSNSVISSPHVTDDGVYFGTREGYVFSVDPVQGTAQWRFETNDLVAASAVVADGMLFTGSFDETVYSLNASNGEEIWRYSTGSIISSPIVVNGIVYAGSNYLHAIDAETGDREWRFDQAAGFVRAPTYANGTVYFAIGDGVIVAVDAQTGEEEWRFELPDGQIDSSPTVSNDTLFIGTGRPAAEGDPVTWVYAIDASDGTERWRYETGDAVTASPTVVDDTVFVGSKDGSVYAFERDTGTVRWQAALDNWVDSSPTVLDGSLFVGTRSGTVYAIDAGLDGSSNGSRVRLGTLGHHDSIADHVTITRPAFFALEELDVDPAPPEEDLVVTYRVTNSGDVQGTQDLTLAVDGQHVKMERITLDPGEREESSMTFRVPADAAGEDLSIEVASEDDAVTGEVTIPQPATFDIVDVTTNSPVAAGEELEVSFDVSNTGGVASTQTVEVSVAGGDSTSLSIDLAGGETTTETVAFETSEDMVGETTVRVASVGDSVTASVTVNEFTGDGDSSGEGTDGNGGGGGGLGTTEIAAVGGGGGLLALLGGYALLRRRGEDDDSPTDDGPVTESTGGSPDSPSSPGAASISSETGEGGSTAQSTTPVSPEEPGSTTTGELGSSASDVPSDAAAASGAAGAAATADDDLDIEARLEEIDALFADARENREAMEYDQALADTGRAIEEIESLREKAEVKAPHRISEIDPVLTDARDLEEAIRTERDAYRDAWERYQDLSNTYDEVAVQADPANPDEQLERLGGLTTKLDRVEEPIEEYNFENLAHRISTLRQNCNELVEDLESGHATIQDARSNVDELEAALVDAESSLEAGEYGATIQQLDEVEGDIARTSGLVESYETPELDEHLAGVQTRWEDLRERATEARGQTTGEPDEIPTVPRLQLEYSDIERIEAIGTGGNADVYRARVPTPDGDTIDIAVKEPRLGGVLHEQTVKEVPGGTDPPLSPDSFEQPETSRADVDEAAEEHVPGGSGTRAWSRDENIDPEAMDPDYQPGAPTPESEESPTKIQPGGESESRDTGTKQKDEGKNQLLEEAEKWEKIDDHDHIVGIVDYGDEPLPWIAMEYMDGGHIAHRAGRVSTEEALWIAISTTKAVRHAHRRGIAHLDLKPDNILFRTVDDAWDAPKVADWGLSKLLLNHSQSVAGLSTHYAAPEQFDREFGEADDITDIYQLGAVFYELFTGEKPFEGRPAQVMRKVLTDDVTPPSEIADVPPEIDDILLKALAREKADRYETVVNLRNDLQDVRDAL